MFTKFACSVKKVLVCLAGAYNHIATDGEAWSVVLSVTTVHSAKEAETIVMSFGMLTGVNIPRNQIGPDRHRWMNNFEREKEPAQDMPGGQNTNSYLAGGSIGIVQMPIHVWWCGLMPNYSNNTQIHCSSSSSVAKAMLKLRRKWS